ncbi:hypothetical protein SXIM_18000 [Streptomyces xiamenensis]|uniref:Uncharacterized protein n=1 Tax=Streptomyces xiamenensis TaxID=408015 RepID=A0A0F7FTX1_9ACTN|nr:hypothetical protein SXIM_18000 [Streptomyces xiamenensis]
MFVVSTGSGCTSCHGVPVGVPAVVVPVPGTDGREAGMCSRSRSGKSRSGDGMMKA